MPNSIEQNDDTQVIPKKKQKLENENPKIFLGDYEIFSKLGSGTYGKVFKVSHKDNTGVQYAIKYFKKTTALKNQNQMSGLKKEFDIMKQLDSVFVTNLIEVFQTQESLCFVMEACEALNFYNIMLNVKKMIRSHAIFFSAELFLGIKYLHEKNIVHQDLKLENLLITKSCHLKICDFGLSEPDVHPETRLSKFCGTLAYFSPEKVKKIEYTMKTDWWTFGIIVAEFFGCLSPFERKTNPETKFAIENLKMELVAEMPEDALDLVHKLLKYEDQRLSQDGISAHPFFNKVVWKDLEEQRISTPWNFTTREDALRLSISIESETVVMDQTNDVFKEFIYKRLPRT
ncbi:unnamed protein product [Caenorhabditis brenneri]